jgi:hypothetical protein
MLSHRLVRGAGAGVLLLERRGERAAPRFSGRAAGFCCVRVDVLLGLLGFRAAGLVDRLGDLATVRFLSEVSQNKSTIMHYFIIFIYRSKRVQGLCQKGY